VFANHALRVRSCSRCDLALLFLLLFFLHLLDGIRHILCGETQQSNEPSASSATDALICYDGLRIKANKGLFVELLVPVEKMTHWQGRCGCRAASSCGCAH